MTYRRVDMIRALTVTLNAAVDTTLTVPTLEAGGAYTAHHVVRLPGGKGLNVARALRRLDIPVCATGLIGGGPADFIEGGLTSEGIIPSFVHIAGESRTCTAIVELERHRFTEINEPGPFVTADELAAFEGQFADLLSETRIVMLCGSLPIDTPDDYYARLSDLSHLAGVPVVLDTSGRALAPGLAAEPLMVKPNAKEASALLGRDVHGVGDALEAGSELRERGAGMAVVTLGASGAVLVTAQGAWSAHCDVQVPLSTVGSGDAFTGGFVAGLWNAVEVSEAPTIEQAAGRADVLVRALILASACGAANTQKLGAGVFDIDEVNRLRRTVVVRQLDLNHHR